MMRFPRTLWGIWLLALCFLSPAQDAPPKPLAKLTFPLERTAYFNGESIPLSVNLQDAKFTLEAIEIPTSRKLSLYEGSEHALILPSAQLAPGDYNLSLNGEVQTRLTIVSPLRRSVASLQDESTPDAKMSSDEVTSIIKETGLTAVIAWDKSEAGIAPWLDPLARGGTISLFNPDTRPTSFNPGSLEPGERNGMIQRMAITAQANSRFPNFGGFMYGWDTTGFSLGGRKGLLVYWQWGKQTEPLKQYIDAIDAYRMEDIKKRTGMEAVRDSEYLAYLVANGRNDLAGTNAIDLPTRLWIDELSRVGEKWDAEKSRTFEKRLDAWSDFQMSAYGELYGAYSQALRKIDPSFRHSASVQVDHNTTRAGQYFPRAYAPLDFQYQSTWNDQVGGPDYQFQWLITAGLLDMHRGARPTWLSNVLGPVHGRASYPGKFTRVAAHGLPYGMTGVGFALEGFSNVFGGMNEHSRWKAIKGKSAGMDLLAGRDFMERFAALALHAGGGHGVGILFSKTQYGRQNMIPAFGSAPFNTFITLARLGYTPRYVTEEELSAGSVNSLKAILVLAQTVPLPQDVRDGIAKLQKNGTRVFADGGTQIELPGAEKLEHTFSVGIAGKPTNWSAPNMVKGETDALLMRRVHQDLAPVLHKTLGACGRAELYPEKGVESEISVLRLRCGAATYFTCVNDSAVGTQSDWFQVRENLKIASGTTGTLYDCTEESVMGPVREDLTLPCDLTKKTARVFALLPRELKKIDLAATQTVRGGGQLLVRVSFLDEQNAPIPGALPFQLRLETPSGELWQCFYRATDNDGKFSMTVPIPANVVEGEWKLSVRSQLNGARASLPIQIRSELQPGAVPLQGNVMARNPALIRETLKKGARVLIPIYDSAGRTELQSVAEGLKARLNEAGVAAEILINPEAGTYTLAYAPTAEQKAANQEIDAGSRLGKIIRQTVNGNDWFSAKSGWRSGVPLILLQLQGTKNSNPVLESLNQAGLLWPKLTPAFPGAGKAVIQAVAWAVGPEQSVITVQAQDVEGLKKGIEALLDPPADGITPGIQAARETLWRESGVGGRPLPVEAVQLAACTSNQITSTIAPEPFTQAFAESLPPEAAAVVHPKIPPHKIWKLPAEIEPRQYVLKYRWLDSWIETDVIEALKSDLRFSQGIALKLDVAQAGKIKFTCTGQFRYSDRSPRWQPQWDEVYQLREKLLPKKKVPMEIEVYLNGKLAGKILPNATETREVELEAFVSNPKKAKEEVVTELTGIFELPAGEQEVLLVPQHMVDGVLKKISVIP